MKLLPPPGPERRRLLLMVGALIVLALAYYKYGGTPEVIAPATTGPQATPTRVPQPPRAVPSGARRAAGAAAPSAPQPLKLAELEQVPDEPVAGRNLFRYGVKPPPPPPPYVPPPPPPPTPIPPPPGPPPIALKLTLIIQDPYTPGRSRAYLVDPKTGATFEQIEGDIVDGRYKLLKVGQSSVVMSYLDGSGQRTINLGG
jgi:hypothetical protein